MGNVKFWCLFLFLIQIYAVSAQENLETPGNKTPLAGGISQDEMILYNMINDFRRQNKHSLIPLSPALCTVSHTHIDDILSSQPQKKGCSLHSWSESVNWSGCCHVQNLSGMQCMKIKPKEITGYPGFGYELIYWGEEQAMPADAFNLWQQTDASADMILGRGKWKGYQWNALGVGIKEGYALIWLGDKKDKSSPELLKQAVPHAQKPKAKLPEKQLAGRKENSEGKADTSFKGKDAISNRSNPAIPGKENNPRYYLIVASVKTAKFTNDELRRFKAKGYPDAVILKSEKMYRIALMSFDTEQMAKSKLDELKGTFPDIWIYRK